MLYNKDWNKTTLSPFSLGKMLYNEDWNKTTVDPFSLDSLIAWLEKKPENGSYQYTDPCWCLLALYFKDCGFKDVMVGPEDIHCEKKRYPLPIGFDNISNNGRRGWTFGEALDRAIAYRNFYRRK